MLMSQGAKKKVVIGSTWSGRWHWTRSVHRATRSTWDQLKSSQKTATSKTPARGPHTSGARKFDAETGAVAVATASACSAGATLTWRGGQSEPVAPPRPVDRQTHDTGREVVTHHQHRANQRRLRRVECTHGSTRQRWRDGSRGYQRRNRATTTRASRREVEEPARV